jgi:ribosome-associated protein
MSSEPVPNPAAEPEPPEAGPAADTAAAETADLAAAAAETSDPAPAATPDAPPPGAPRAGLPARTSPPPATDRDPLDLARRVVELAEDKKAADIVLLEVGTLTTVADYLVICSGGSERQLDGIADGIVEGLKAEGLRIIAREGEAASHWVLLDVGAVIVHVFAPPERDFYALERLWSEARTILRVQ